MKNKHLKQTIISSIFALLIVMTCVFAPEGAKAQQTTYTDNYGRFMGTPDARMVFSIHETDTTVKLRLMMIGEAVFTAFNANIAYDSTVVTLVDSTYTKGVKSEWFNASDFDRKAYTVEPILNKYGASYVTGSILHGNLLPYNTTHKEMKVLGACVSTGASDYNKFAHPAAGEMLPVLYICFKKNNQGVPLKTTDIGFTLQREPSFSPRIPTVLSSWTCAVAGVLYYWPSGLQTLTYEHPEQFIFRSPSSVRTDTATNVSSNMATLNGNFKRGDWDPSREMVECGMIEYTTNGLLNYDVISQYGFIYADIDANITVKEFADTIIINGVNYEFPTPVEIAAGSFTRDGMTFNIVIRDNVTSNKSVDYNVNIAGLAIDHDYYAWAFKRYSFETSNIFPEIGNKITFRTAANCPVPTTLTAQTFCGTLTPTVADLFVTVSDPASIIEWTDATGAILNPMDLLINGATYYVKTQAFSCTSDSIAVKVAILNDIVAPEATTPQTFCIGSLVSDLKAKGINIQWYDAPSGGNLVNFSDALIDGTIYYASQNIGLGSCESSVRTAVKVIIDETISAPVVSSPQSFCNMATLDDIATDGSTIVWYTADGSLLPSNTYLTNNTTYYAARIAGSCESTERTPVLVYTGSVSIPVVVSSPQRFCLGTTLENIDVPNNKVIWYASATDTNILPANLLLGDSVIYYASLKAGECESVNRTPVLILLDGMQGPDAPSSQSFCGTGYTLADLTITGSGIKWYDAMTGGNLLPASTALTSTQTFYYAAQTTNGCTSSRIGVKASSSPNPVADVQPIFVCSNDITFDLTAAVTPVANNVYIYYAADMTGTVIVNPTTLAVPVANTIYYVKATDTLAKCKGDYTPINVTVNPAPIVSAMPAGAYAGVGGTTIVAVIDNNTNVAVDAKTAIIRDENIASITFASGMITVTGKKSGNTEIVYTSVSANGCITELIIPVQTDGSPTGILTGKDIVKCNVPGGGDTAIVQIAHIMGGVSPWTVTIQDDKGTFRKDTTIESKNDLPVNIVVTIPENTGNVPEYTTYTITNIEDITGSYKQSHYGFVRIGTNPTPSVNIVANKTQTVCAGQSTLPVSFSGVETLFRTDVNKNIGAINFGKDGIASFIAINNTNKPDTATIVVTPEYWYNGVVCYGKPDTATIIVNPSILADFVTSVTGLGIITFTDTTKGSTSWSWNFGDGATSNAKSPAHQYAQSGTYMVTLTATSANGCTSTVTKTVTVNVSIDMEAKFDIATAKTQCLSGNSFAFTNTSKVTTPNHSISAYAWDFGDGSAIVTTKNATHTYTKDSTYTVTLTITETPGGTQASYSQRVTVLGIPEIANDANPGSICEGNHLTAQIPTINWKNNAPVVGAWMLDGKVFDLNTIVTSADSGKVLQYQIMYACGTEKNAGQAIVVYKNPVADFSTALASIGKIGFTDVSSNATSWLWNFGDGATSNVQNPTHQYAQSGTYNVSLTVTSANGCTSIVTKVVNVSLATDMEAKFDIATAKTQCLSGNSFAFTNTSKVTTPNHSISTYAWDFGDGSALVTTKDATHTYTKDSTYTVTLTITETPGGTQSSYSQRVTVLGIPEIANDANPQSICEGSRLIAQIPTIDWKGNTSTNGTWLLNGNVFNIDNIVMSADSGKVLQYQIMYACGTEKNVGQAIVVNKSPAADYSTKLASVGTVTFTDASTNAVSWSWNFGDGTTSMTKNPTHKYTQSGVYDVKLTVTSAGGCTSTITKVIHISTTTDMEAMFDIATASTQCLSGNSFAFNSTSTITTSDHSISSYMWYFGDGNTAETKNAIHTYAKEGTYTVTLVVTESPGGSQASYSQTVTVLGIPVIANDANPQPICEGNRLTMKTPTIDWKNNVPVAGSWLLDGNIFDINNAVTYADSGKVLQYQVAYAYGCGIEKNAGQSIVVYKNPVADFSTALASVGKINFTDASSNAISWLWNFGDGSATSIDKNPTHQYAQSGIYNVSLTVTSSNGCTSSIKKLVYISTTTDLEARFDVATLKSQCLAKNSFVFNNTSKITTPNHSINAYAWNFGDGSAVVTTKDATHTYTQSGTYMVTLVVTEMPGGTQSSYSQTVKVLDLPVITDTATRQPICEGNRLQVTMPTVEWNGNTPIAGMWLLAGSEINMGTTLMTAQDNGKLLQYRIVTSCGPITSDGMSITVNATPVIAGIANKTYCASKKVNTLVLGSNYKWRQIGGDYIGLTQLIGSDSIPSFTATNGTTIPLTAIIEVTPVSGTCTGNTVQFTMTVNPEVTMISAADMGTICSDSRFTYTVKSDVNNVVYTWVRPSVAGINNGSANSGAGSRISETLSNATSSPVEVTYQVTSTYGSCSNQDTVKVVVNPSVSVTVASEASVCKGAESLVSLSCVNNKPSMPVYYKVTFTEKAQESGFQNMTEYVLLEDDAINISLPSSIGSQRYLGVISVRNTECESAQTYNFAINVMKPTTIVSQPIVEQALCQEKGSIYLMVEAEGSNLTYQWYKDGETIEGATKSVYEKMEVNTADYGNYTVKVTGDCGTVMSSSSKVVENDIFIMAKWDDVILVSRRDTMANKLEFQSYQWYRFDSNGDMIAISEKGQSQYYSEQNLSGTFAVKVIYADGTSRMSCPYTLESVTKMNVKIYPNPAAVNGKISVVLDGGKDIEGSVIEVYDVLGRLVTKTTVTESTTELYLNVPVGTYIFYIIDARGTITTEKVIIK